MGKAAICSVPNCAVQVGPRGAKGWCPRHYKRSKRHGDPLGGRRGANGRTATERFVSSIDFDGPEGCWLASTWRPDGYAVASTDEPRGDGHSRNSTVMAHHFMWWLVTGACPADELDHTCYRRNCVRFDHLEPVSHAENLRRGNEQRRKERAALRLLLDIHPELIADL